MIDHTVITPNRLGSLSEAWSKNLKTKWGVQDMIDLICQGHKTIHQNLLTTTFNSETSTCYTLLDLFIHTTLLGFTPPFRDSTEKTLQKSHAQAATDSHMAEVPIGPWVPTCHHLWAEWTPLVWNQWWRSLFLLEQILFFRFFVANQNHVKCTCFGRFQLIMRPRTGFSADGTAIDSLQSQTTALVWSCPTWLELGVLFFGMFRWKPARPKGNSLISIIYTIIYY